MLFFDHFEIDPRVLKWALSGADHDPWNFPNLIAFALLIPLFFSLVWFPVITFFAVGIGLQSPGVAKKVRGTLQIYFLVFSRVVLWFLGIYVIWCVVTIPLLILLIVDFAVDYIWETVVTIMLLAGLGYFIWPVLRSRFWKQR